MAPSGLCPVPVGGERCRALETASEVGAGGGEDTGFAELRERPREEGSWRRAAGGGQVTRCFGRDLLEGRVCGEGREARLV